MMEYNKRNSENSLLQVHFGKNGSTHISIGSALTIKEALEKPMKLRELVPEMCGAFVIRGISKTPLSWETRISKIKKETIYVEETGFWPVQLSHCIEKRKFSLLSTEVCDSCKKRIYNGGFVCTSCNYVFHKHCFKSVPIVCEQSEVPKKVLESLGFDPSDKMTSEEYKEKLETTTDELESDDIDPEWEIPSNKITMSASPIGMGSFGMVYKGDYCGPVAVKILRKTDPSQNQISDFKNEISLLKKTRHANVLLFMGCATFSNKQLGIVTEWCEGSSLYQHIHVKETDFDISNIIQIAIQTSQGMNYLHDKNIVHRDLKSNNIFLYDEKSFLVKIGDFGLAAIKEFTVTKNIKKNTPRSVENPEGSVLWMAPEIIKGKTGYGFGLKGDMYAFGIVLYELLSGILPYSDGGTRKGVDSGGKIQLTPMQIMWLVASEKLVPNMSAVRIDTPRSLRSLILQCIEYIPTKRPTFANVLVTLKEATSKVPKITRRCSFSVSSSPSVYKKDKTDYIRTKIDEC